MIVEFSTFNSSTNKYNDHIFLWAGDNGDYPGMTLGVFQVSTYEVVTRFLED